MAISRAYWLAGMILAIGGTAQAKESVNPTATSGPESYRLSQSTDPAALPVTRERREYQMYVFSDPAAGRTAEFNHWYSTRHVQDVLEVPELVSGQRFESVLQQPDIAPLPAYLATFEMRTRNLGGIAKEMRRRMLERVFVPSDSMRYDSLITGIYAPDGRAVRRSGGSKRKATWILIELIEPLPGKEAELQRWYRNVQLPSLRKLGGLQSFRRFSAVRRVPEAALPRYMTRYEFDGHDPSHATAPVAADHSIARVRRLFYRAITPVIPAGGSRGD